MRLYVLDIHVIKFTVRLVCACISECYGGVRFRTDMVVTKGVVLCYVSCMCLYTTMYQTVVVLLFDYGQMCILSVFVQCYVFSY